LRYSVKEKRSKIIAITCTVFFYTSNERIRRRRRRRWVYLRNGAFEKRLHPVKWQSDSQSVGSNTNTHIFNGFTFYENYNMSQ
jgi:hypothetical protein